MYETEPFQENEDVQHTEVLVHELSSSDSRDDVPPTMDSDDSTDGEDTLWIKRVICLRHDGLNLVLERRMRKDRRSEECRLERWAEVRIADSGG
ncbi:unnamed protein product [Linum trigynum]|uniref:Uncharacterized protein n=1 Tax=Linum trigynum TaxID=586398 RepID=A0AAV2CUF0_9ROSI